MQIQLRTDNHVDAQEQSALFIASVENAVRRFATQITRVEIHLSDENSHKAGSRDKRCMLEARLAGLPPLAVTHQAPTMDLAVDGAAAKLTAALATCIGRLRE